jgi:hypothetical protein
LTDIDSLGCTLYFLLSGMRCFPRNSVRSGHAASKGRAGGYQQTRPDARIAGDSPEDDGKSRDDRYQSCDEVVAALTEFSATATRPPGSASPNSARAVRPSLNENLTRAFERRAGIGWLGRRAIQRLARRFKSGVGGQGSGIKRAALP